MRGSIFDDPGDEKSWRISQRSEDLIQYYAGREPSWYSSAIAPLKGADRVLDLGCGPGLALRALRDQGSSAVLGIERWPAFVANSTAEAPIVAHDLTLPMPFLESGSFDGVFSHYALDYVSPVCVRQVLREARRVLAPGGRLLLYLAAIGLGGGDESRTISYSPQALRVLLEEAGFDEVEVEASPNGRNSVARARHTNDGLGSTPPAPAEPRAAVEGATQLSASFSEAAGGLELELSGSGRSAVFTVDLPSPRSSGGSRPSACARVLPLPGGGTELQLWAWRGFSPIAMESARLELQVGEMRLRCPGAEPEHVSVWSPGELLGLEPPGNAYARFADLPAGGELSEAERGAEGRQVVVESDADGRVEGWERLGPGRNRFLIRRASGVDVAALDREWLSARLHGAAVTATELEGERNRELLLWCSRRQSLLYLGGASWESILATASRREDEMEGPVVLVDPALARGEAGRPLDPRVAAFAAGRDRFFVLLGAESWERSAGEDLASVARRLLLGGRRRPPHSEAREADETLRYLTERTVLMRLRQTRVHSWAEIGRRTGLR